MAVDLFCEGVYHCMFWDHDALLPLPYTRSGRLLIEGGEDCRVARLRLNAHGASKE